MKQPVVYDKAKYHYGGEYPKDLPRSQAFVHTGMYLGWLIDRDLISQEFARGAAQQITRFRSRKLSPISIYKAWDGCLVDDMISHEGNDFSAEYFDFDKGSYLYDYNALLAGNLPSLYHVKFSWETYAKLARVLDSRYASWVSRKTRRWWQFWK